MADDFNRLDTPPLGRTAETIPSYPSPLGQSLFGLPSHSPMSAMAGLAALGSSPGNSLLGILPAAYRRRAEWNERFTHWERSESDSETRRIERARDMVKSALEGSAWLRSQQMVVVPQGSFTNRTNTRLEADIDLRVQSPALKVECGPYVDPQAAWTAGGYSSLGVSLTDIVQKMRVEILARLYQTFDQSMVSLGNKAIKVKGLAGSRSEVDVVPAVTLHRVTGCSIIAGHTRVDGVAILSLDGSWTANFPDQHLANGRAKRLSTNHQFKRVVRIIKRLRTDMEERGILANRPSSFLVECLIYLVEDQYFTVTTDDRYGRVKRVLARASELLSSQWAAYTCTEINEIKPLFGAHQAWTHADAASFLRLASDHLGNV